MLRGVVSGGLSEKVRLKQRSEEARDSTKWRTRGSMFSWGELHRAQALKCLQIREMARRSKMKLWGQQDRVSMLDFPISEDEGIFQTFYKAQSEDNAPFEEIYVLTWKYGHNVVKQE